MITLESIEELKKYVGKVTGKSPWVSVSQNRINKFAKATEDYQWIHLDEEKSKEGPFGSTIAHGFLTLSLAPWMSYNTYEVKNIAHSVNYGLDKVRFLTPVNVGSKVRTKATLLSVDDKGDGRYLVKNEIKMEIEGQEKPAYVAEALTMYVT